MKPLADAISPGKTLITHYFEAEVVDFFSNAQMKWPELNSIFDIRNAMVPRL